MLRSTVLVAFCQFWNPFANDCHSLQSEHWTHSNDMYRVCQNNPALQTGGIDLFRLGHPPMKRPEDVRLALVMVCIVQ